MYILFLVSDLALPLVILIMTIIIKRFPPRFKGAGYHTAMAEKNELTWNTAQWLFAKYAVIFMIPAAVIGAVGGVIGIIKHFDEDTCSWICVGVCTVQTILVFAAVILTEVGLHRRFDKNGNPK